MPSGSRHTLQVSRLASQSALQWLGSVNVKAWNSIVGALKPVRPGLQCFVTAKLKRARLPVVARPLWHVRGWVHQLALPGDMLRPTGHRYDSQRFMDTLKPGGKP